MGSFHLCVWSFSNSLSFNSGDYTILWITCYTLNSRQQFHSHTEGQSAADRWCCIPALFIQLMRSFSSSCHDGFRLRGGLLPQRGGEGVQTDQRRDRETTAARQERRQTGAEAAAAGYVTAGGPSGPRGLTTRESTDAKYDNVCVCGN